MKDFNKMYSDIIGYKRLYPERSFYTTYYAYTDDGECRIFEIEEEAYQFGDLVRENFDNEAYQKAIQDHDETKRLAIQEVIVNMGKELGYNMRRNFDKGLVNLLYEHIFHQNPSATFNEIFKEMKTHNYLVKQIVDFMKNRVK